MLTTASEATPAASAYSIPSLVNSPRAVSCSPNPLPYSLHGLFFDRRCLRPLLYKSEVVLCPQNLATCCWNWLSEAVVSLQVSCFASCSSISVECKRDLVCASVLQVMGKAERNRESVTRFQGSRFLVDSMYLPPVLTPCQTAWHSMPGHWHGPAQD